MAGDSRGAYISRIWGSKAVGFEKLTVADAAVGLTAAEYGNAQFALVSVETADIRCKWDGEDPTAAEGIPFEDGDKFWLESAEDIANFKAIRSGSDSAVLNIMYSL
jgi:hypothetical protein